MTKKKGFTLETQNAHRLLDEIIHRFRLRNDAGLARKLEVAPPLISKIRHRRLPVGPSLLIRMHEATDVSIKELKQLLDADTEQDAHRLEGGAKSTPASTISAVGR